MTSYKDKLLNIARFSLYIVLVLLLLQLSATQCVAQEILSLKEMDAKVKRAALPGKAERYADLVSIATHGSPLLTYPANNISLPIKSYPNGTAEVMLYAKHMKMSEDMMLFKAENAVVRVFTEEGTIQTVLWAQTVIFDRKTMLGYVPDLIFVQNLNDRLTGRKAYIDTDANYVEIIDKGVLESSKLKIKTAKRGLL